MTDINRRHLFGVTITGAVAFAATASAQVRGGSQPKRTVAYQPTPKDGRRCGGCTLFRSTPDGGRCVVVEGEIAPNGWCVLHEPKT